MSEENNQHRDTPLDIKWLQVALRLARVNLQSNAITCSDLLLTLRRRITGVTNEVRHQAMRAAQDLGPSLVTTNEGLMTYLDALSELIGEGYNPLLDTVTGEYDYSEMVVDVMPVTDLGDGKIEFRVKLDSDYIPLICPGLCTYNETLIINADTYRTYVAFITAKDIMRLGATLESELELYITRFPDIITAIEAELLAMYQADVTTSDAMATAGRMVDVVARPLREKVDALVTKSESFLATSESGWVRPNS